MKRIVLITALFLFCTSSAFAINNFYVDILGVYSNGNDAGLDLGGGYAVGYNIIDNVNIIHRGIITSGKKGINQYEYMFFAIGAEYTWFFWDRFGLRGGALFGISPLKWKDREMMMMDDEQTGYGVMFFAGIHANITQYVAFFLDVGFHYNYYKEEFTLSDGPETPGVLGETIQLGVRFTIGKNNRMSDGY